MQRALRALRGEQRAVPEGLRILLQTGPLLGRQEEGELFKMLQPFCATTQETTL